MNAKIRLTIGRVFRRLNRLAMLGIVLLLLFQIVGSYFLDIRLWNHTPVEWMREAFVSTITILLVGFLVLYALYRARIQMQRQVNKVIRDEIFGMQSAIERYEALQVMASTLSATLSFERVVEQAVSVCGLALEDLNVPPETLIGVVFLFDGQHLVPLNIANADQGRVLAGNEGVVGEALRQGEPAVTDSPHQDPELGEFETLGNCLTAVCLPLRAGYQLFGALVLGSNRAIHFEENHFHLFSAVADQTVIALQSAQMYQRLEEEKQRLIDADMKARRELARDLHDGPVQKIAAMVMRLSVLKSMSANQPEKLPEELEKLEAIANSASQELRHMLFTLRPLLLDSKGLGPAIDSMLLQIGERDGIETSLVGGENGRVLDRQTQSVVFAIIEEALSNAGKHARANTIDVRLWQDGDLFIARVTDDGDGFDLREIQEDYDARGSLGLINMQERAERIDGSLQIESAPGEGTIITLVVPLDENGQLDPLEEPAVYSQAK